VFVFPSLSFKGSNNIKIFKPTNKSGEHNIKKINVETIAEFLFEVALASRIWRTKGIPTGINKRASRKFASCL